MKFLLMFHLKSSSLEKVKAEVIKMIQLRKT